MNNFFNSLFGNLRAKKGFFVFLLLLTVLVAVLAVISAIKLDGSVLPLDLSNITFIKFLSGKCGFVFFIVGTLLNLAIFYFVILIFCSNKFCFPLGVLFYLYFAYSQIMVFTSIILIYGIMNTLVLLMFLLVYYLCVLFLLMLMLIELSSLSGAGYFKCCFNKNESNLIWFTLALVLISLLFCVLVTILKSFVILLVF